MMWGIPLRYSRAWPVVVGFLIFAGRTQVEVVAYSLNVILCLVPRMT
jgi:hypothetical protein